MTTKPDLLPSVGTMMRDHGLWAWKKWGQHFLLDQNITDRIADQALGLQGKNVIEVGPGPGALSRSILKQKPNHLILIELDRRFQPLLDPLGEAYACKVDVIWADALSVACHKLGCEPRKIIANLPYNIATPLILKWLRHIDGFENITVLIQREVADRFLALPNTSAYGRLSVMSQWVAHVERCFHVPPSVFVPPPQVESTVIRFTPKLRNQAMPNENIPWEIMEKIVALAFQHRRKMLKSALRTITPSPETLLESIKISSTARAEDLTVADFVNLVSVCQNIPIS